MDSKQAQALFTIPDGAYLLNHSVGSLPHLSRHLHEEYLEGWANRGGYAWDVWLAVVERFDLALAQLFNSEAKDFCAQANVSSGLSKIMLSLPKRPGRTKIILSEWDFPTVGFVLAQAERLGYELVYVAPDEHGCFPLDAWDQAMGEDTQVVVATHALYGNSALTPVQGILAKAKEKGIFTVVDIAQSAGVVPIDLSAWEADFAVGTCMKWLCGGSGTGFLWANPKTLQPFEPLDVGWFSHQNPFEFDIHKFRFADDAKRFWGGTPSIAPLVMAAGGIETVLKMGMENIHQHNRAWTQKLRAGATDLGIKVITPGAGDGRGGTMVLAIEPREESVKTLNTAGIHCDSRPHFGLRFSPHLYNALDQVDSVLEALAKLP